ncbi:HAMP domain-containing sensor histidine kinase [Thalassobaculum sp.]|uniref:sensor histidine kinase n=2 Tax=Thalassobaculum sp. TaxID=2022740 RepID=UPI0032ED15A6
MMRSDLASAESDRRLSREAAAQLREIAHELRNPLNALTAIAEIFRDQRFGPLPGERYPEYADLAHGAALRMLQLCDRLLLEDPAARSVATSPVGRVLADIVGLFGPMAEERGVSLVLDLPDTLPEIQVEAEALTSAVNNLVVNAIKFTPRGGRVTVAARTEPSENVAVLVISDTGVGMDPEEVARAMAPGWAGAVSTLGVHGDTGSGMGLAVVRRQVEALGGSLELRSARGKGTCAIIRLPLPGGG